MALEGFTIGSAPAGGSSSPPASTGGGGALSGFTIGNTAPESPAAPSAAPAGSGAPVAPPIATPAPKDTSGFFSGFTGFLSKAAGVISKITSAPDPKSLGSNATINTLKFLPSELARQIPGVAELQDDKELQGDIAKYGISGKDVASVVPGVVGDAVKGFAEAPVIGLLDVVGASGEALTNGRFNGQISFNVPGLGKISNDEFTAAKMVESGMSPLQASLRAGSASILNALFFADVVNRISAPRGVKVAETKGNVNDYTESTDGGPRPTVDGGPKTGRLYEPPTAYNKGGAQVLPPEVLARMEQQGVKLGSSFNPEQPVFFKVTVGKGGTYTGEIIQVKPSYLRTIYDAAFGTKTPTNTLPALLGAEPSVPPSALDNPKIQEAIDIAPASVTEVLHSQSVKESDIVNAKNEAAPAPATPKTAAPPAVTPPSVTITHNSLRLLGGDTAHAEKGAEILRKEILKTIAEHGKDVTKVALTEHLGVDMQTAENLVREIQQGQKINPQEILDQAVPPHAEGTPLPSVDLKQPTKLSNEEAAPHAEVAAASYWRAKIAPSLKEGSPVVIGGDDLKKFFGKDYNDNNHPIYSKAANTLFTRALKENKSPDVVFLGGGPGSGKTEIVVQHLIDQGFRGTIYDSNLSNYEGASKQVAEARAAGKNVRVYGVLPNLADARGFTIKRAKQTGRAISDNTFAHGHSQFPAALEKLLEKGEVSQEEARILDTRGVKGIELAREMIATGQFPSDPLALLRTLDYNKDEIKQIYGKENYNENGESVSRDGQELFQLRVRGEARAPLGVDRADQGADAARGAEEGVGPAEESRRQIAHRGFVSLEPLAKAIEGADAQIKDFVEHTLEPVELSDNVSFSFDKLEGAGIADLEAARTLLQSIELSKEDDEALYAHAEDPKAPLTDKQKELFEKIDAPLRKVNQFLFEKLRNDGIPMGEGENYISRFPMGKPSVVQRILEPGKGQKISVKQGGILSKTHSSFKKRTMKALTDSEGNRTVASIKDGNVTAFKNKKETPLGKLSLTKNQDLLDKEIRPLQHRIDRLNREARVLESVKVGTTGAEARLRSLEDQALSIQADFFDTSQEKGKDELTKDKKKLRTILHDISLLSKVKDGEDIVLRKERLATLEKKTQEAANEIADIFAKYDPETLNHQKFIDANGTEYTIGEATTKEIEEHTNLQYYHSALTSRITQYIKLRQIDRANAFMESWKNSADFKKIAVPDDQIQPDGWRRTSQVNFRNYYFEPRTAEVLDDFQGHMDAGNYNDAFRGINRVLADAIFFNGLAHPINVFVTWITNRGATSLVNPVAYKRGWAAGTRALRAMQEKNEDYLTLLKNGAHLMSSDISNQKLAEVLAERVNDQLAKEPDLAGRLSKILGVAVNNANIVRVVYKMSHDMAWFSNDFFTMQSIFEVMDRDGISMEDAIKETSRFIPDYRQQQRLLDVPLTAAGKLVGKEKEGGATARFLARIVYNRNISMFGSYHVGLMESLKNMVKDTVGVGSGFTKEENVARAQAADKLLMLALLMIVIYPWLDKKAKEITGTANTYVTRSGITKYPYLLYKWANGDADTSQVLQQAITPAVGTELLLEQFFNKDFFTGNDLSGPAGEGRLNQALSAVAPFSEFQRVASGRATIGEFAATLLGVHTPKNTKIALDLNSMIYDEKPKLSNEVKAHVLAGDDIGALALVKEFNNRLKSQIKAADIAGGNSGSQARVDFFFNKYGLRMPTQETLDNYAAKQGQNIVQKTLPNGKPVIVQGVPVPATGVIGVIQLYAKAIGVDPATAFKDIFTGQTIRNVENGAIIVNRMSLADSQAAKIKAGENNANFKLDHIVPLEGGGDNSDSNLQIIPTAQWKANTKVENFIGNGLKSKTLTAAQAREIAIRFKAGQGEVLSPKLMQEYKDKYKSIPLSLDEALHFLDK